MTFRREVRYKVCTFSIALQSVSVWVIAPTAEAVRQIVRVEILNCRSAHD